MAETTGIKAARLKTPPLGRSMTMTPLKPTRVAIHRRQHIGAGGIRAQGEPRVQCEQLGDIMVIDDARTQRQVADLVTAVQALNGAIGQLRFGRHTFRQ